VFGAGDGRDFGISCGKGRDVFSFRVTREAGGIFASDAIVFEK